VLLELAQDHEAVRNRLARLRLADRPDKLASGFRRTLSAWRRSTRFLGLREAAEFAHALETWLEQVARELLPKDPVAALGLFESFLGADHTFFDRADDSDGSIGNAARVACRHRLQAAARCEGLADGWPDRLVKLYSADDYGGTCRALLGEAARDRRRRSRVASAGIARGVRGRASGAAWAQGVFLGAGEGKRRGGG